MWHGRADCSTLGMLGSEPSRLPLDRLSSTVRRSNRLALVLVLELDSGTSFPAVVDLLRTGPLRLADEPDPARFSLHEFFRKRAIRSRAHAIRFVFDDWFTEAGSFS